MVPNTVLGIYTPGAGGGGEGSPEADLQREGARAQEGGRVRSPRRCKADGTPGLHL